MREDAHCHFASFSEKSFSKSASYEYIPVPVPEKKSDQEAFHLDKLQNPVSVTLDLSLIHALCPMQLLLVSILPSQAERIRLC